MDHLKDMIRRTALRLSAAATLLFCAGMASAQSAYSSGDSHVEVLSGWTRDDGARMAAFRIQMPKGWKTYWRAPGDGGIPPVVRWAASGNLARLETRWPTPQVFDQNGLKSIGYVDSVVVPIVLTPRRTGAPIRLRGSLEIGICKDVCMPASLQFQAKLDSDDNAQDAQISAALADRPMTAAAAGLRDISCALSKSNDGLRLSAEIVMPAAGAPEFSVVEAGDPQIWVAEATTRRRGSRLHIDTELMHVEGESFALNRSAVRITVLGSHHAVDIRGCPAG